MLQQIKVATLSCFLFLVLSQCGAAKINYGNPKSVSLGFYRALGANDLEKAKLAGTEETQKVLTLLQTLSDAMPSEKKEEEKKKLEAQLKLLKKAKCEVDGDVATCTICCDEAGAFEKETIQLKKVDKRWLVHLSKEDLQK